MKKVEGKLEFSITDIVRYFSRAVLGDIAKNIKSISNPLSLYNIVRYRFHQYLGSYYGNHLHKRVSSELRDTYFYPSPSKGIPLTSATLKS